MPRYVPLLKKMTPAASRRHRRREQRADDRVVAARLADDGAAQMIEARAQIVAPLGHRGARAAAASPSIDDARRLAFGVRVDDADRASSAFAARSVRSRHGLICTVLISV